MDRDDVCVLLPSLNESETVGDVIEGFRQEGFDRILVIDGGSTDGTCEVARERGARVVQQSNSGKGQAVREAVREYIELPYVLLVDADGTYRPEDADRLLAPLLEGEVEHVIGNRFADMQEGSMTRLNHLGNRLINGAFRTIHRESLQDILSGYRAFSTDSFGQMDLTADGFGIETEMAIECVKRSIPVTVVPISYLPRPAGSNANLRPIRDGGIIFLELYRRAKTNNPLFYFGSVGLLSTVLGLGLAGYLAYDWLLFGVTHEVLSVLSAFAVLFGVQLLMFGVLSDMILSLHREQMQRFRED
jgi:dolichol-phosphate mannosyltransferase